MNDDQLQREIEEALKVEPSPQFAAGVRARIAEKPQPWSVWIRWAVPAAGLAAAAIVLAFVVVQPKETRTPKAPQMANNEGLVQPAQNAAAQTAKSPETARYAPAQQVTKPVPQQPSEPEVLFDPRERVAMRRFIEGVEEKRIDVSKLVELQEKAKKTAPILEIALMPIGDLEPVVIEPLASGARKNEGGTL